MNKDKTDQSLKQSSSHSPYTSQTRKNKQKQLKEGEVKMKIQTLNEDLTNISQQAESCKNNELNNFQINRGKNERQSNQPIINTNNYHFQFDIRQYQPLSPQVNSLTHNQLKEKANELVQNSDTKQGSVYRNQKNNYQQEVTASGNPKSNTLSKEELINCLKDQSIKEPIFKKIIKRNTNDNHLELQFQLDTKNIRVRFHSMRAQQTVDSQDTNGGSQNNNLISKKIHEDLQQNKNSLIGTVKTPQINKSKLEQKTDVQIEIGEDDYKECQMESYSDSEHEDELREIVCDLPPKIEDMQIVEQTQESEDDTNEAPTVVIDSSLDEPYQYREEIDQDNQNEQNEQAFSNIQAALQSIKLQEDEQNTTEKKKVTILSVEEEQALEQQINEIRERIKKGETIGQQEPKNKKNHLDYRHLKDFDINFNNHFQSVDGIGNPQLSNFFTKGKKKIIDQQKPPLYSLTFAHPEQLDIIQNPLSEINPKFGFHSIDQNVPVNCVIADGPNIFEKKKQRYEKIQKLRVNAIQSTQSEQITQSRNRDDCTPISNISANIPSMKKSADGCSTKGGMSKRSVQFQKLQKNKTNNNRYNANGKSRQSLQKNHGSYTYNLSDLGEKLYDDINSNQSCNNLKKRQSKGEVSNKKIKKASINFSQINNNPTKKTQKKSHNQHLSLTKAKSNNQNIELGDFNKISINTKQEEIVVACQSYKKMKTPKLKLDDNMFQQQSTDKNKFQQKLNDLQVVSQYKSIHCGKTTKNEASSKSPFFQPFSVKSGRDKIEKQQTKQDSERIQIQERRVGSHSFHNNTNQNKQKLDLGLDRATLDQLLKSKLKCDAAFLQMKINVKEYKNKNEISEFEQSYQNLSSILNKILS